MRRATLGMLFLVFSTSVLAEEPFEGETLISPLNSNNSFLIDMDGIPVKTWRGSNMPAAIAYLLSDNPIVRPCKNPSRQFEGGGIGGRIQKIDADENLIWNSYFSNYDHQQHHDFEPMPGGNVLLIAWQRKTIAEAIAAGRQGISDQMWPTLIVEMELVGTTGGDIGWEWHIWDHLIQDADPAKENYRAVADLPKRVDINQDNVNDGDWIHSNAVDYNPDLDQIVFTSNKLRFFRISGEGG